MVTAATSIAIAASSSSFDTVNESEGVTIVIRTLNEQQYITRCLRALKKQRYSAPVQIIIVDSGSDDLTLAIARAMGCDIVEIPKAAFSYGRALNIGISHAKYNLIVSISAHCVPLRATWLENLVAPLRSGHAHLAFGPHIAGKGSRTSEKTYFSEKFARSEGYCNTPMFNNGNAALTKHLWLIRPFDENLAAQEDVEFSRHHMAKSNAKLYFTSQAAVIHYHNDRNKQLLQRLYRELSVEYQLEARKMPHFFAFCMQLPISIVRDFYLAQRRGVLLRAAKGILGFRITQLVAHLLAIKLYLESKHGEKQQIRTI